MPPFENAVLLIASAMLFCVLPVSALVVVPFCFALWHEHEQSRTSIGRSVVRIPIFELHVESSANDPVAYHSSVL